ncbi:hypothetical protein ACN9MC_05000 [Ensifer adhaerens]|uniref:hypothetical protein n=1 Tax=Ensifer adhaerens TaxID=106592 RepID=UPI003CEBD18E
MTTPYTAGTVTLTNGSAVITGIGTAWQTALIAGGILIAEADGNPLPILSVDSNTQITAAIKWKGVTGTYPYAIMRDTAYGQQTVANAQALSNYLTRLDTATLSALNALGPSMIADRVPYATSNAAMAWAPFTAYGRTLVAATTDGAFAAAAKVVRRTGGPNMGNNDVMIGWHSTLGGLIAQVDAQPLGNVWTDHYATNLGGAPDIRSRIGAFSTGGGTVTGNLQVNGSLSSLAHVAAPTMWIDQPANQDAAIYFRTGASVGNAGARWAIFRRGFGSGEPGANAGSDLVFGRWDDNAAFLGMPLIINRRYGIVETRENPMAVAYAGAGAAALNAGQHIGVLGATTNFDFIRGANGAAPTIGGNPGIGGRAVHVPVAGWYKVTACAVVNAPSGASVFGLGLNGGSWVAMYAPVNGWTSSARVVTAYLSANAYLSWCGIVGLTNFSLENSSVTIELLQL